jgi:hypothetical protein
MICLVSKTRFLYSAGEIPDALHPRHDSIAMAGGTYAIQLFTRLNNFFFGIGNPRHSCFIKDVQFNLRGSHADDLIRY